MQRRVFVTGAVGSLVGMTGLSDLARALTDSDAPAKAVTEHDCARHLAWGMWQSGRRSIHASELPSRIAQYLDKTAVGISESGLIVRDEAGYYSFAHESLLDFFVAQRIFAGIASGDGELLTTAQTTHNTDLVIRQFASRYRPSANLLASWMNAGQSAVLRVNSAGILAKLNSAQTADEVIVALKRDVDARALYLTAVLSRVLRLSWDDAATLLANMKDDGKRVPDLWKPSDLAEVVDRFCVEAFNTRDAVARWLSISLLSRMREFAPENIAATFDRALDQETSRENLRAIASALSGHEPDPL